MKNRTTGIIVTTITALLFGCLGIACLCVAVFSAIIGLSNDPYALGTYTDPSALIMGGLLFCCLSIVLIAIPFIAGYFLLRKDSTLEGDEIVTIDVEAKDFSKPEEPVTSEEPEELESSKVSFAGRDGESRERRTDLYIA